MIFTGPEDATSLIPMRSKVLDYVSKSKVMVTIFKLFVRVGLRVVSLSIYLIFGRFDNYNHALSNLDEFVSLSLFRFGCSSALAISLVHRIGSMVPILNRRIS